MIQRADQPIAGPSSRPYGTPAHALSIMSTDMLQCEHAAKCAVETGLSLSPRTSLLGTRDKQYMRRQLSSGSSSPSSLGASTTSSSDLFAGPATTRSYTNESITFSTSPTPIYGSSSSTSISSSIPSTSTFSAPWSFNHTRSSTTAAAAQSSVVPGVIINLVFAGDSDSQAVYSVPMAFGHGSQSSSSAVTSWGGIDQQSDVSAGNGGNDQTLNVQVDLGSSDLVSSASSELQDLSPE